MNCRFLTGQLIVALSGNKHAEGMCESKELRQNCEVLCINAVVVQRRGSGVLDKKASFLWVKRWSERKKDGILGMRSGQREAMECARLKAEEAGWEVNEN